MERGIGEAPRMIATMGFVLFMANALFQSKKERRVIRVSLRFCKVFGFSRPFDIDSTRSTLLLFLVRWFDFNWLWILLLHIYTLACFPLFSLIISQWAFVAISHAHSCWWSNYSVGLPGEIIIIATFAIKYISSWTKKTSFLTFHLLANLFIWYIPRINSRFEKGSKDWLQTG